MCEMRKFIWIQKVIKEFDENPNLLKTIEPKGIISELI